MPPKAGVAKESLRKKKGAHNYDAVNSKGILDPDTNPLGASSGTKVGATASVKSDLKSDGHVVNKSLTE